MKPIAARRIVLGLTLGVLLALVIAPQTRWLVQTQFLSLLHFPSALFSPQAESAARVKAIAAQYPNDYQIQYSATVWNGHWPYEDELRTLETRFPKNASLRANILRYACMQIHDYRDENYLLEQMPVPPSSQSQPPTDPAILAAFDRDAIAGERLDPDNAYFPFMRAVGLYAAHQDTAAQAAILRAGTDTRWKEYTQDEVEGRWRLSALVFGSANDAVARSAVAAAVLFPQYASLRAVSRVVTYQAIQDEEAGNYAHGIALRQALIHCGGLMRGQCTTLIGNLVGIAIAQVAMSRPDGSPMIKPSSASTDAEQQHFARTAAYIAYLHKQGDAQGVAQVMTEWQADRQVLAIAKSDLNLFSPYTFLLHHVIYWWIAGLLLLSNALWLLICASLAWLVGRLLILGRPVLIVGNLLLLILGVALAWWTTQSIREYLEVFNSFIGSGSVPRDLSWLVTVAGLVLPVLVFEAGLVRLRRAPLRITIAAIALPFACLVLLVYAGITLRTARQEQVANIALTQALHGEGQYMAAQGGQSWPSGID